MDISEVEYLAYKFHEFCNNHRDLCPHDFQMISHDLVTNISVYRCRICQHEIQRKEQQSND